MLVYTQIKGLCEELNPPNENTNIYVSPCWSKCMVKMSTNGFQNIMELANFHTTMLVVNI